jgi:hypothetical protein
MDKISPMFVETFSQQSLEIHHYKGEYKGDALAVV